MSSGESRLLGNAAGVVILTIAGLMAGLAFGFVRSWIGPVDPLVQVGQVVSGGIVGSVIGLGLAILLAARERDAFRSVKKTMAFAAVTAIVVWAIIAVMRVVNAAFF